MPYDSNSQLPEAVQNSLSESDQTKWRKIFNSALSDTCDNDDVCAAKVAWSRMKKKARNFAGWATVEIVDKQGDKIDIGAFKDTMPRFMKLGSTIIDKHTNRKVGSYIDYEFRNKDSNAALWMEGVIYKGHRIHDETWEKLKSGEYPALSIGADPLESKKECDAKTCWNAIKAIDLFEISVVDAPANPEATIEEVNHVAKSNSEDNFINKSTTEINTIDGTRVKALEKLYNEVIPVIKDMTWDECIREMEGNPNVKDPEALCGWMRHHGHGVEKDDTSHTNKGDSMTEPETKDKEDVDGGEPVAESTEKEQPDIGEVLKALSGRLEALEAKAFPPEEEEEEEEEEETEEKSAEVAGEPNATLTIKDIKKAVKDSVQAELKKLTATKEADTPRPDLKKHEMNTPIQKALEDPDALTKMSIKDIDAMMGEPKVGEKPW